MDFSDAFRIVNLATGVLLVLGGISQFFSGIAVKTIVVGIYGIIFGGATALLEFQIPPQVAKYASFMFSFIGRGAFYFFLGCVLLGEHWYNYVPAAIVALIGLVYIALEFVPSIEPPANMRDADAGWGAEQVNSNQALETCLPKSTTPETPPQKPNMTEQLKLGKDAATNERGIPFAPFVERVEDYVTTRADVEKTLQSFSEMISYVPFLPFPPGRHARVFKKNTNSWNQARKKRALGLKDKIPDIQKTLETVQFLKSRDDDAEPLETSFELNDTLFAKANIEKVNEVYLWLGANVMLSYPIPEAEELLTSKLSAAQKSLSNCEEDLDFLREQITTMEVATARVYNWDIGQKRKEKEADGS
ncbi:hypothetical protein Q7P37_006821 [Cladosporium fusiforme]